MIDRCSNRRTQIVAIGMSLFWAGLLSRVASIQLGEAGFRQVANSQRTTSVTLPAATGRILDRHGKLLAVSVRQPSIYADPSKIESFGSFSSLIAPVLQLNPTDVEADLVQHAKQKFRWLRRRVDEAMVARLNALDLPKGSWGVRHERRRVYPQGTVAAHILGLRGLDGDARGGIEEQFADELTGSPGVRRLVTDSLGRPMSLLSEVSQSSHNGAEIRLTIDARLSTAVGLRLDQAIEESAPAWAVAIVIDPRDGGLLAVESRPGYDPNDPVGMDKAGFHHAFRATFEPGSTVKPLIVAAALKAGVVTPQSIIDCGPGRDRVAGRPMRDAVPLGNQPLKNVLAKSSNIGSARVAELLGPEKLYRALADFGFGQPVPTNFNTPISGKLSPPKRWSRYSLGSLSMGHEIAVTPLQLAAAYASMSQGRRVVPRLIAETGELIEHAPRSMPRQFTNWLLEDALVAAVESGTAKSLRIDGNHVFGKTGTAQKFDVERGEYRTDRATCVVVGGVPATAPTHIVVVVIDDPTVSPPFSGGRTAGPVARDILDACLRLAN